MSARFFFDHDGHGDVARGLRRRGVDVLTAYEDGAHRLEDSDVFRRAVALGRVLYFYDDDHFSEIHRWQRDGRSFPGAVHVAQTKLSIGEQIEELELIAKAAEPEELRNQVLFLPLR
ncbi:MAG TPA: DUF5615 family PIN-like protein [Thermoanaerobaculia bacterium]|nr:DUF5615 family PIN-like protein [Thermoanaerobaculia bacterium]